MWLVFVVWLLLCVDLGIGLGVMGACGHLRSRGGWGFLWLVGFQKYVKDLVGEDGGCYWSTQNKCGIVLSCLNVLLCYVVVILARCCGWVRMSVSVP